MRQDALEQRILYEEAKLPDDQDEVEAHYSARNFLERFEEDLVSEDCVAASQSPESGDIADVQEQWGSSPPNKRQKVLPLRYRTSNPPSSQFGSEDQEPDLNQTLHATVCGMHMEIDSARSQCSQSPAFSSSLSPRSPEPIEPVTPYFTLKPLANYPPYGPVVRIIFASRRNVWVKTSSRPTALDLWDRRED